MTEGVPPPGNKRGPEAAGEHTPKEWREKLRGIISSEGEAELLGVGKMSERLRAHLAERSKESDTEIKEKCGQKIAEFVNARLEAYNKLHWSKKLFITGALVASVSLTSAVAPIISGIFTTALYGQRIVGGAGLLKSQREKLDTYEWSKDRSKLLKNTISVIMAGVWAGGAMYAVNEAVEKLNELGVDEWISKMFGNQVTTETPISAPDDVPVATVTPELATVPAVALEVPIVPEAPPIPDVSISASVGHGYEYMMKRLWEELPEDLDASAFPEGSDIRRLIEADADSIDKVVHQIAADPEHGFFNADGTSVQINLDSHMTVNVDGDIQLDDTVKAPEGAPMTPAYHPETPPVSDAPSLPDEESVVTPDDSVLRDNEGRVVYDGEGNPVHTGTYETPPGTNEFGLTIPADEPHIYADSGGAHLFVYGGSQAEQTETIREYLAAHPKEIIYGTDDATAHRIPFYLHEGKVAAGLPVRTSGFLGFFSSWMKAPGPDEFAKIIK